VIRQAPGERAYHIFYQVQSGFNKDLVKQLELDKGPKGYWYCNQAETTIKGVDDKEEFGLTDEAFDILMFSNAEKMNTYRVCAGILHMGEMNFKDRSEQAEPDGEDEGKKCATAYGCDYAAFVNAMCKPRVKVGTEWVNKGQNSEQVLYIHDSQHTRFRWCGVVVQWRKASMPVCSPGL
jgi:myosin heavy subunit